ncbi:MAG: chorismate synthase, partial [Myxococcota bacterium]
GKSARMRMEQNPIRISSGVVSGVTTGSPIALQLDNADHVNWMGRDIAPMTIPRPGHVDYAAATKYGYDDLRHGSERASARETAMRVCAGALCVQLLEQCNIRLGGWVAQIGPWHASNDQHGYTQSHCEQYMQQAAKSAFALCDCQQDEQVHKTIFACMKQHETLGGVLEVAALGVPIGLGSHVQWDRRLDAQLAMAVMSIPAIKAVEVGPAFANAGKPGTQVHDAFVLKSDGTIQRHSNNAGGIEGGISNGQPIVVRAAMKPINTTLTPQNSVDLATGKPHTIRYERSDFCAVTRAVPIVEAMVAMVLTDALLHKLGGDSMQELKQRFEQLPKGNVSDFELHNRPWRMEYVQQHPPQKPNDSLSQNKK